MFPARCLKARDAEVLVTAPLLRLSGPRSAKVSHLSLKQLSPPSYMQLALDKRLTGTVYTHIHNFTWHQGLTV